MTGSNHIAAFLDAWRAEVVELSNRYAQPALVTLTTQHVAELEKALRQDFDEPLTLREAANVLGFTDDYLGRLVRQGKLQNIGRRNAPRVRRGDLPRKSQGLQEFSQAFTVSSARTQIAQAVIIARS
jgi:hypothetical protein